MKKENAFPPTKFSLRPLSAMCVGTLTAASGALGLTAQADEGPARPNIILVLTDDQGWTQHAFRMDPAVQYSGCDYFETPAMDRLAREGMRFTDGYASAPICTPTRRSILCGMTTARQKGTEFPSRFVPREHLTIPRALKSVDPKYYCAHFGKWGESMETSPAEAGYDESDGVTGNHTGDQMTWEEKRERHAKGHRLPLHAREPLEDPKESFSVTDRAVDFIDRRADNGSPFYLQVSYYAMHTQIQSRPETLEKYRAKGVPSVDVSVMYAAMVEDTDECIGRLLAALDERDLADKTYVFFCSDNGGATHNRARTPFYQRYSRGEDPGSPRERIPPNFPLRGSKQWVYEGGIRVPFVVRGPGVKAGSLCRDPVYSVDFLRTFYHLAGGRGPLPDEIDGGNLDPLLTQRGNVRRTEPGLVFHRPLLRFRKGKPIPHMGMTGFRQGDWKLVVDWVENRRELYNLREDIGEQRDLAAERPEKTEQMLRDLTGYLQSVDAEPVQAQIGAGGERTAQWIADPAKIEHLKSLAQKALRRGER
jgi:arylsulfatase A